MWATRGELAFGEPKLADGHHAGKFETILPNVAIQVAAVVAAPSDAAAGHDALRHEMKWAGTKGACGAGKKGILSELSGHVVAVLFPLIPIVGAGDGRVARPHGRIGWGAAGRDLREERRGTEKRHGQGEKEYWEF